jgi:hypothetical protein
LKPVLYCEKNRFIWITENTGGYAGSESGKPSHLLKSSEFILQRKSSKCRGGSEKEVTHDQETGYSRKVIALTAIIVCVRLRNTGKNMSY